MKNYETGICDYCGQEKSRHIRNDYCYSEDEIRIRPFFKDSGLAHLEESAPKLLKALKTAKRVIDNLYSGSNQENDAIMEIEEAINEALKRE